MLRFACNSASKFLSGRGIKIAAAQVRTLKMTSARVPNAEIKNERTIAHAQCNSFEEIREYEECVRLLNGLQTNARTIELAVKTNDRHAGRNITETIRYCELVGVTQEKLSALNVIHVAGSKGKGSTCAFVESILRHHGYRTGFYSSPHLLEVRERMCLNGKPLSYAQFVEHFRFVYERVAPGLGEGPPTYFKFLTVLALYVFCVEQVDVAILEVGIGGRFDCTNVIERPRVCAVTSLGFDHVALLGNTIDKIAYQKAGIFKRGAACITVPQGDSLALQTLAECATRECQEPLHLAPAILPTSSCELGIKGDIEHLNASLAVCIASFWMQQAAADTKQRATLEGANANLIPVSHDSLIFTEKVRRALRNTRWMGRYQTIDTRPSDTHDCRVTYFLDGAHTVESIELCLRWFVIESECRRRENPNATVMRVLVFNCTGDRNNLNLLKPFAFVDSSRLSQQLPDGSSFIPIDAHVDWQLNTPRSEPRFANTVCSWQRVFFVCNNSYSERVQSADNLAVIADTESQLRRCETLRGLFQNELHQTAPIKVLENFDQLREAVTQLALSDHYHQTETQSATIERTARDVHVLVTGSLHLVGCALQVLHDRYPQAFAQSLSESSKPCFD